MIHNQNSESWLARSPDLSALDFFSWSCLKLGVNVNKPQTECGNPSPAVLARVIENAINGARRAHIVINFGGGHLADIISST